MRFGSRRIIIAAATSLPYTSSFAKFLPALTTSSTSPARSITTNMRGAHTALDGELQSKETVFPFSTRSTLSPSVVLIF